ncbi:MAG: helix-turn-helix transcriptional regulator [Candidatus Andeanibacterium colombiense]|uniref:Helix-turn-helix transcriptional regulator n=1 Tax=Candidatus Andeanibacterium colombiense TaxID=3121345 RepID=A0AAJ5X7N8_9SPHN|nr:MAG: helix-turn-helix transcriptional regulator [Sphingomonadaceae bacterium]
MNTNLADQGQRKGAASLTPFGVKTREIRKEKGILLLDMARLAKVTSGFLSMVETGRKAIPEDLVGKIVSGLNLGHREANELQNAAKLSAREYRVKLKENADPIDRRLAFAIQEQFAKMTPMKKQKILDLLEEE